MSVPSSRLNPEPPVSGEPPAVETSPARSREAARTARLTQAATTAARPRLEPAGTPRSFQLLAIAASALLLAAAIFVVLDRRQESRAALHRARAAEMQILSQRIAAYAPRAAAGESGAHEVLRTSGQRFGAVLDALAAEESDGHAHNAAVAALRTRWTGVEAHLRSLLAQRSATAALAVQRHDLAAQGQRIDLLVQRVAAAVEGPASAQTPTAPLRQLQSSWTSARSAHAALLTDALDGQALHRLAEHARSMGGSIHTLLSGRPSAPVRESAEPLREALAAYAQAIERSADALPALTQAQDALRALSDAAEPLFEEAARSAAPYPQLSPAPSRYLWAALLAAGLAFGCLLWIGKVVLDDAQRRAGESMRSAQRNRQANQRTQQAILHLLDEISTLAQGDLTVRASVSDEATGAIADAINYAVGELRRLVTGINAAATRLAEACTEAQALSGELLNASQRQSQEIAATSASVAAVAASVMQVSNRAAQSARVARSSLAAAAEGSGSVRRSVAGMESIREQMQETAKRVKRLGESSQEIGEIVDLISDITQRTEVLAVNAAIQANAGSGAGRGFGSVAEEVQRLAARSAQAAQQIGAVVKTIQADTQDATSAMERSTERVVEQTGLAYAAGEALGRIERVSRELARLIAAISIATREQREAAERIHAAMDDILHIAELTTEHTRHGADRSAQLAGLARELKQSVAGFKLS